MPPQLQLSLLNVPPAMDAIAALPRPQHVILNHIYLQVCASASVAARCRPTHCRHVRWLTLPMPPLRCLGCTHMCLITPAMPGCNPLLRLQRMTTSTHAMVVGTTHRYRSKYVTTVM